MGNFFLSNRRNHGFGVKGLMQDIGTAQVHPGHQIQHGAVENDGAGMQHHAFGGHPPGGREQGAVHGADVVSMDDALERRSCRWST